VRDLATLHVRAMLTPHAAGQRFIAAGDFLWIADMARMLKSEFGERAAKVPTRIMPDPVVRLLSLFLKPLKAITPGLGRRHVFNADKARRMLEFAPRPATQTIVDCARSLLAEPQHWFVSALRRGAAQLRSRCSCRQSPHAEVFRRRNPSRLDRRRERVMYSPDPCGR
jgi:hypothetical protein